MTISLAWKGFQALSRHWPTRHWPAHYWKGVLCVVLVACASLQARAQAVLEPTPAVDSVTDDAAPAGREPADTEPSDSASDAEACELNQTLRFAYDLMKGKASNRQILAVLEKASLCPDAALDAEFLLYHAAALLRGGEGALALDTARKARRAAVLNDDLRARATRFIELIEQRSEGGASDRGVLHKVTFQLEDGSKMAASIVLEKVALETLPADDDWQAAFPQAIGFYAQGIGRSMVQAAQVRCKTSDQWPLSVWLPTGLYSFSTGQQIWVQDDIVIFPKNVRFSEHTPSVGMLVGFPFTSDSATLCTNAVYGPLLEYAHRLGNDLLLTGSAALLVPMGAANDCFGEASAGLRPQPTGAGTVGVSKPFTLLRDTPLLVGLAVGGMGIHYWAKSDADGDNNSFSTYKMGAFVQPFARVLIPLPGDRSKPRSSASSTGVSGGKPFISVGGAVSIGQMFWTDLEPSASAFLLLPELRLGGSWVF